MARPLRLEFKGALYHIYPEETKVVTFFFGGDDYQAFLGVLKEQIGDLFNLTYLR